MHLGFWIYSLSHILLLNMFLYKTLILRSYKRLILPIGILITLHRRLMILNWWMLRNSSLSLLHILIISPDFLFLFALSHFLLLFLPLFHSFLFFYLFVKYTFHLSSLLLKLRLLVWVELFREGASNMALFL